MTEKERDGELRTVGMAAESEPAPKPKPVLSARQRFRWREVHPGTVLDAGYVLEESIDCIGYVYPDGKIAPHPDEAVHWCPVQIITSDGYPTGKTVVVSRDTRVGKAFPVEDVIQKGIDHAEQ